MKPNWFKILLLLLCPLLTVFSEATAQDVDDDWVAKIQKIMVSGKEIKNPTEQVEIFRHAINQWIPACKDDPIYGKDSVKTVDRTDVLLQFSPVLDGGTLWLNSSTKLNMDQSMNVVGDQAEKIVENFYVKKIGLEFGEIIAKIKGDMKVKTDDFGTIVGGTEFYLRYDPKIRRGYVYVFDGIVTVSNDKGKELVGKAGYVSVLKDQRPQATSINPDFHKNIFTAHKKLKAATRSWWLKSKFLIPVAITGAAGTGALIYLTTDDNESNSDALPLPPDLPEIP